MTPDSDFSPLAISNAELRLMADKEAKSESCVLAAQTPAVKVSRNLLSIASRFPGLRQSQVIVARARMQGGKIVHFVRDNGIGFAMRYGQKVYGIFQCLHRVEHSEGIGAGLAIVRRIVRRRGWQVSAEAVENPPATFPFYPQIPSP